LLLLSLLLDESRAAALMPLNERWAMTALPFVWFP
jgi:hypothetical protein